MRPDSIARTISASLGAPWPTVPRGRTTSIRSAGAPGASTPLSRGCWITSPFASITFVAAPDRFLTSALDPTVSMRPARRNTASAQGRRGSPVQTRAFTMASAVGADDGSAVRSDRPGVMLVPNRGERFHERPHALRPDVGVGKEQRELTRGEQSNGVQHVIQRLVGLDHPATHAGHPRIRLGNETRQPLNTDSEVVRLDGKMAVGCLHPVRRVQAAHFARELLLGAPVTDVLDDAVRENDVEVSGAEWKLQRRALRPAHLVGELGRSRSEVEERETREGLGWKKLPVVERAADVQNTSRRHDPELVLERAHPSGPKPGTHLPEHIVDRRHQHSQTEDDRRSREGDQLAMRYSPNRVTSSSAPMKTCCTSLNGASCAFGAAGSGATSTSSNAFTIRSVDSTRSGSGACCGDGAAFSGSGGAKDVIAAVRGAVATGAFASGGALGSAWRAGALIASAGTAGAGTAGAATAGALTAGAGTLAGSRDTPGAPAAGARGAGARVARARSAGATIAGAGSGVRGGVSAEGRAGFPRADRGSGCRDALKPLDRHQDRDATFAFVSLPSCSSSGRVGSSAR